MVEEARPARRGARVELRPLTADHQAEFVRLARASAALHEPWVVVPRTEADFAAYLRRFDGASALAFALTALADGALVGFLTFADIVGEPYRRAVVGYAAFAPSARRGYLREGLGLALQVAFGDLGLHRVEADIQPGNDASVALVKRLGFRQEGFSPGFVRIGGVWRDHERWAITADMLP